MDLDEFLPIFQEHIDDMRSQSGVFLGEGLNFQTPHLYSPMQEWGGLRFRKNLREFVAMLYVTNLLSQVVAFYFSRFHFKSDKNKLNTFPEIFGFLCFSDTHICPAALPMAFIYAFDCRYSTSILWHHDLEDEVWRSEKSRLDQAVNWIEDNLEELLPILCELEFDAANTSELKKLIRLEHNRINDQHLKDLPTLPDLIIQRNCHRCESTQLSKYLDGNWHCVMCGETPESAEMYRLAKEAEALMIKKVLKEFE